MARFNVGKREKLLFVGVFAVVIVGFIAHRRWRSNRPGARIFNFPRPPKEITEVPLDFSWEGGIFGADDPYVSSPDSSEPDIYATETQRPDFFSTEKTMTAS